MKRAKNKGRTKNRYASVQRRLWSSLERFHAIGLRLAGFLHQFKTPLHVIQSQTEFLLEDASLSEHARKSLGMILQNAARLSTQTQVMMDAARGNKGNEERVPVEQLLESICNAAEVECRKRHITLEKTIQPTAPIAADTLALEGALHNLVNNAIEAMPQGGVLRVKSFPAKAGKAVGVEIQDSGEGMQKADLVRLQHPFQTSKAKGTGLGVFITKHILRRHHATVKWLSQPGHGTTVTIFFPQVAA